jgi:tetratricopeptide (TPR) repeat protein
MGPRARRRQVLPTLLCVGLTLSCLDARAQDREPPSEAVDFYRTGREHFAAGRYREAIVDLERALTLDPGSATLTYNLARVHELLGELDPAIGYYNSYIRLLPDGEREEKERIRETIGRLDGARGQVDGAPPPATPPEGWDEEGQPRWVTERGVADLAVFVAGGATAVLLVTGAIVGLMALDRESTAERFVLGSDGTIEERDTIANDADNYAIAADVLLLGAVAGAVATGLLYMLRTRTYEVLPEHDDTTAFVAFDQTGAAIGLRGAL